jgi:23S rRNA pseudouridine1911/1915/1917 synthase
MKTVFFSITPELNGWRLDKAMATLPEIGTRSRAAKLINQDLVQLKSRPVKASHITQTGETFAVQIPAQAPTGLEPYAFPLTILHEDADVIVVNKPAGLVMHPAVGHAQDTLVNALLHHTTDLAVGFHEQRPGIVHRLDKETSGVLVVAKNNEALEKLADQFHRRSIHRVYFALVHGQLLKSAGTVESWLRRHPTDRKRFASEKSLMKGKRAVTHFQRLKTHPSGVSLVRCQLETGRTHQIRVHMAEMSHPILGDSLYGARARIGGLKNLKLRKVVQELSRIGLHAAELGFNHPRTGQIMNFTAPWPEDLLPILKLLDWE